MLQKKLPFLILFIVLQLPFVSFTQGVSSNPVLYLPFCNDAKDHSGFGNDGKEVTAILTSDKVGNENNAYSFNDTDQHINISPVNSLHFEKQITVSCWIYFNSLNPDFYGQSTVISAGPYVFELQVEMLKLAIEVNGASGTFYGNTALLPKTWYFVSCTYDFDNSPNLKLYVNGNLDGSGHWPIPLNGFDKGIRIGNRVESERGEPFKGKIDEVRIFNKALNESEIKYLYNLPVSNTSPMPNGVDVSQCKEGVIELKATGGTNYKWYDKATGGSLLSSSDVFFTPFLNKTDTFYVSNTSSGCESIRDTVIAKIGQTNGVLGDDIYTCKSSATLTPLINDATIYKWITPENKTFINREITAYSSGNFILIAEKDGCVFQDTIGVHLNYFPAGQIKFSLNNSEITSDTILWFASVPITLKSSFQGKKHSWIIDEQEYFSDSVTVEIAKPGEYDILLAINNEEGCILHIQKKIYFKTFFIPNVITPNGDNINDFFEIISLELLSSPRIKIFNRWGGEVYSSSNYKNRWNGSNVSTSVYYYSLDFYYLKQHYLFRGALTILK